MNIIAKVIITSNNDIKNIFINDMWLILKETIEYIEVYEKQKDDLKEVLIYSKNIDEKAINYIKDNYEVIKIFNIGTCTAINNLDLNPWDVIIPNTILNDKNKVFFIDFFVDKNYDLKNFWLTLNWISLSKENIKDEEELYDLKERFSPDILDKESFKICELLENNWLSQNFCIIKVVWEEKELLKNWSIIAEIMW